MASKPSLAGQTPSQTVGPFFTMGLTRREGGHAHASVIGPTTVGGHTEGERICIVGQVLDGEGSPVDDALIELWQADAYGRYPHPRDSRDSPRRDPSFLGFARAGTGAADRAFTLHTVKPGAIGDGQAPHLNLIVFMRGGLNHLYTRVYFDDEAAANASDPVLCSVPGQRRDTLVARREQNADGIVYHFDIHMQGARETVFFDV